MRAGWHYLARGQSWASDSGPGTAIRTPTDDAPGTRSWRCDNRCDITTDVITPDEVEALRSAVAPLCVPLHDSLAVGVDQATQVAYDYGLLDVEYRPTVTHVARGIAHRELARRSAVGELGPWSMAARSANVRVQLCAYGSLSLRLLHADSETGVPAPGRNRQRREYWANNDSSIYGVLGSYLLGLWDLDNAGTVSVRIVRPKGLWAYRGVEKVDVDFFLPRATDELAGLEFRPDDEDIELDLAQSLDEEEGGSGDDGLGR